MSQIEDEVKGHALTRVGVLAVGIASVKAKKYYRQLIAEGIEDKLC